MEKKIKTLRLVRYDLPAANTVLTDDDVMERLVSETDYEARWGKVTRERQYDSDGLLEQETEYAYNNDGFLIREVIREADGEVMTENSWEYEEGGRILKEYHHYADGSKDTIHHIYDADKRLVKKITEDADGEVEQVELFDYTDGFLTGESVYEEPVDPEQPAAEELVSEKVFVYDGDGRLLETLDRDLVNEVERRRVNEYDEETGHRTGVMVYNERGDAIERIQLLPDEEGRPLEVVEETRQKKNTIKMHYNEQGMVHRQEEYDMKGKLVSKVDRVYDDYGHLLESRVLVNMPGFDVERHYVVRQEYSFYS
ncbi:MAG: hypothetical protein EA394_09010 [Bacteroidia bacterium]|nr:MAG: hypothetical protein EA394_09010 [Bacteroidia bacterium]